MYGGTRRSSDDPHWRDLLLFYEYFHGDNGAGIGASHQTGWTGLVARHPPLFATAIGRRGACWPTAWTAAFLAADARQAPA